MSNRRKVPGFLSAVLALQLGAGSSLVLRGVTLDPTQDYSYALERRLGRHQLEVSTRPHQAPSPVPALSLMSVAKVKAILERNWRGPKNVDLSRLSAHLVELAHSYGFDPAALLALIRVESAFRPRVVSPMGAVGSMQLMPATAQVIAKRRGLEYRGPSDLLDPFRNLTLGVAYLSELRSKYLTDSPYFRYAAYNMGPARLDELRSKRGSRFKPSKTGEYYRAIREFTAEFAREI